jgi:hypothetical protein
MFADKYPSSVLGTIHNAYNTLSNTMICTIIYKAKHGICVLSYSVRVTYDMFTDKDPSSVSKHFTVMSFL